MAEATSSREMYDLFYDRVASGEDDHELEDTRIHGIEMDDLSEHVLHLCMTVDSDEYFLNDWWLGKYLIELCEIVPVCVKTITENEYLVLFNDAEEASTVLNAHSESDSSSDTCLVSSLSNGDRLTVRVSRPTEHVLEYFVDSMTGRVRNRVPILFLEDDSAPGWIPPPGHEVSLIQSDSDIDMVSSDESATIGYADYASDTCYSPPHFPYSIPSLHCNVLPSPVVSENDSPLGYVVLDGMRVGFTWL